MLPRFLAAAGLAFLGVLAFLLILVRSDTGGVKTCDLAMAVLQDVSGNQVSIGRCSLDPLGTRVTIENVRIGPNNAPIFLADRIGAGLSHGGFLEGKIRIDQVEVVRPRVRLDLSQPAPPHDELRRPPGAACLPDLGRLELGSVSLTDGSLSVALPDGKHADALGMSVEIHGEGEKLRVEFRTKEATYADPDGRTTADRTIVRGQFDLNAGTAGLDAVDISAPEGSIFVHGELTSICRLQGHAGGSIHANLTALHRHLLHSVDNLGGDATLSPEITFDGSSFEATARAEVTDSTVLQFTPGSFTADFHATNDVLEVKRFELPVDAGKLSASGKVLLSPPYKLTVDAKVDNLGLGELVERVGTPELPVQVRSSGTARISGVVQGPDGLALDMALNLAVAEFGVYDRPFRRRHERNAQRFIGFTHGSLNGTMKLGDHAIEVSHAHVGADGTAIDMSGAINFDAAKGLALRFEAPQIRLEALGPFGTTDVSGTGRMQGTVAGPYSALVIDSGMDVRKLQVLGLAVGDVTTHAHLDLDEGVLDLTGAQVMLGHSTLMADGQLRFGGEKSIKGRLSFDATRMTDLLDVVKGRVPSLAKLEGNLDALMTGDIELEGPLSGIDAEVRLALSSVEAYGQKFDGGTLRTTLAKGEKLVLETLELTRGPGQIRARGWMKFADQSFDMDLGTQGLMVSQIDALASHVPDSTGAVTLHFHGDGTFTHPHMHGNVLVRDWMTGGQPLVTAQLELRLEESTATLKGTLISPWPDDVPRPFHTPGSEWPKPPGSMEAKVDGTLELTGSDPFELLVNLSVPDITRVTRPGLLDKAKLQGGVYAQLHASGTLEAMSQTDAELEVTRLWLKKDDILLETAHSAIATLSEGRLTLKSLALRGDSFNLEASGTRAADGTLAFNSQGTLDLHILEGKPDEKDPDKESDVEKAEGTLTLDLQVNGTEAEPNFVGNASINGVAVRLKGLPIDLTDGVGTVTFSHAGANIDNLTARLNGGKMSVDGSLSLDAGYHPGAFGFTLHLDPFPLTWEDSSMIIAGTPVLHRPTADDRIVLDGELQLVRFRYTRDIDLEHTIVELLEYGRRPTTPQVLSHSTLLSFNLPVKLGDVRIDNNFLKTAVQGDVTLTGTTRRPGLTGVVQLSDAKASYRNNEFNVTSGVINFIDRSQIQPSFDVRADTKVRDYSVHLDATGTLQHENVTFTSEPELSQADIIMLLTIGVTSKDFSASNTAVEGVLLDAAYNASGIPAQMKRLIPKNDLIKDATFKVTSGYNPITQQIEPYAAFETKVLGDAVKLVGETSLVGPGKKAQLDWSPSPGYDFAGQWNDDPSAPSYGDFGADFRYHWEAP